MHCRHQLGDLEKLVGRLNDRGIGMVAISVDDAQTSTRLAERLDLSFPLASDPGGDVADAYGVLARATELAIPSVFVVRQRGTIAWRYVSEMARQRPGADEVLAQAIRSSS